jgi:cephalosporin-C deacetylase-like acetyl esterase
MKFSLHGLAASLFLTTAALSAQAPLTPESQLVFTPYHATGIYAVGERVGWTVTRPADDSCLHYTYTAKKNDLNVLKTGELDLTAGTGTIETASNAPAMILVNIEQQCAPPIAASVPTPGAPAPKPKLTLLGAAVAPELLKPSEETPSDFETFWASQLNKLKKIPINPVLTPAPLPAGSESAGIQMFTIKLDSVDSHVQGYLAKPAKPGKYPAMVVYQWAGVYKLNPDVSAHFAEEGWFTFNVDSHDMAPTDDAGAPKNYSTLHNDDPDKSYFLNMYLRDTRALDYIESSPDWDGKTIVLTGSSMGGMQSLATAALNPTRVTAIAVRVPAGADMNGGLHGRKTGYPNWPIDDTNVVKTSPYFDPVNFAPRIKAATLVGMGFIDTTSPPAGVWTVYNLIPAPKAIVPLIDTAHDNVSPPEKYVPFETRKMAMFNQILAGQPITLP